MDLTHTQEVSGVWAEPARRRWVWSLAAHAVSLADEAHHGGAVQVVEASIVVKVSAVLVSGTETVTGPAVRLTRYPPPGDHRDTR